MLQLKPDSNLLIVARRGRGKTFLNKKLLVPKLRKVIIDRNREYKKEDFDNTIIVEGFDNFIKMFRQVEHQERYTLVYWFNPNEGNQAVIFDAICKEVYESGNTTFVVEEIHAFCTPHFIGQWLQEIGASGRHRNIGYHFTTVSPSKMNKFLVGLCDFQIVGQLLTKTDREFFNETFAEVQKFKSLPARTFYVYDVNLDIEFILKT